jgi:hypothetical protein
MRKALCVICIVFGLTSNMAWAQSPMTRALENPLPQAAFVPQMWPELTRTDVEAAYTLIHDNHPGVLVTVGDTTFRTTLARAHSLAISRAAKVTSYEGYVATLQGFTMSLGDEHVWARPLYSIAYLEWASIITSKRGKHWIVVDEDSQAVGNSLVGAQVIACDGRAVDDVAKESLGGFKAVWSIEAQQIAQAPWLFVNERNPFVSRPKRCEFSLNGRRRVQTLTWQTITRDSLLPRLRKAAGGGEAGFGVRKVGDGYWIALQRLTNQAPKVVAAVKANADAMRAAPFVVLDVRGNGGGASAYGREIAVALFGKDYVETTLGRLNATEDDPCSSVWRVTPDNVKELEYDRTTMASKVGGEQKAMLDKLVANAKAASLAGRELSGPADCRKREVAKLKAQQTAAAQKSALPIRGRMFLLTDHICFSSCLSVTDDFRRLGATHVGETTDAATSYTEVRARVLPSGLGASSTLMAMTSGPPQMGPFEPAIAYEGDIADTTALEKWITQLAKL